MSFPFPLFSPKPKTSMLQEITNLGLLTGLVMCLDAADINSYASGQQWNDVSGQGSNFFVGASPAVSATDPTLVGTPGALSKDTYWLCDGGDWFEFATSNPAWVETWHKDNAKFTLAMWVYFADLSSANNLFATAGNSGSTIHTGVVFHAQSGGLVFRVTSNSTDKSQSGPAVPTGWCFVAISIDEADGTSAGGTLQVNGSQTTFAGTYTAPSSGSATYTIRMLVGSDEIAAVPNGTRMGGAMAWSGVTLTAAQLMSVFNATNGRYGV